MPGKIPKKYRSAAFRQQNGRCHYCGALMWQGDPEPFMRSHGLTEHQAGRLHRTAEHLIARQDGGKNTAENIVAACLLCNQRRHQMHPPPDAETYRRIVCKMVANGGWHRRGIFRSGLLGDSG